MCQLRRALRLRIGGHRRGSSSSDGASALTSKGEKEILTPLSKFGNLGVVTWDLDQPWRSISSGASWQEASKKGGEQENNIELLHKCQPTSKGCVHSLETRKQWSVLPKILLHSISQAKDQHSYSLPVNRCWKHGHKPCLYVSGGKLHGIIWVSF